MSFQEFVVTKQYLEYVKKIERIFYARESLTMIFPYLSDRAFRVQQWLETPALGLVRVLLPVNEDIGDSTEEFELWIAKVLAANAQISLEEIIKQDLTLVLIMVEGDRWFATRMHRKLDLLQQFLIKYSRNVQSLLIVEHENNKHNQKMFSLHRLFQNVFYYPLYGKEDVFTIIDVLSKNWNLEIGTKVRDEIYRLCGGSFWLVKEVVREYRDNNVLDVKNKGFIDRVLGLVDEFLPEEQLVMSQIGRAHNNPNNQETIERLTKVGWIRDQKVTTEAVIPYMIENVASQCRINLKDEKLVWNGIALAQLLSPSEHLVLKLLYDNQNKPVTRDQIGKMLWSIDQEVYSQWAIDQTIKRLRDRLEKLGLPATLIRSVRGVGYEYRS